MTAPYLVLAVPGTGESHPGDTRTDVVGMLANITDPLDPELYDSRWVGYDASYGFLPLPGGSSYAESVQTGLTALLAALENDPRPAVLLGYSQGAAVVSALLDLIAAGHYAELKDRIIGAVLLANPSRPKGSLTLGPLPDLKGYGVAYDPSEHPLIPRPVPTVEVVHPEDVIGSADDDSLIRGLAVLTEFMSLTDLETWGQSLLAAAKGIDWDANIKSFQDLCYQADRFKRAIGEALGYVTGRHTSYNVEKVPGTSITYTDMSARWVQAATSGYAMARATEAAA